MSVTCGALVDRTMHDSQWYFVCCACSRIRARLGFVQTGIMMSTMTGNDNGEHGNVMHYALQIGGLIAVCLVLTRIFVKKRCRTRRVKRFRSSGSETTNWSTVVLRNGIHEDLAVSSDGSPSNSYGERMHLLANSNGSLYTT